VEYPASLGDYTVLKPGLAMQNVKESPPKVHHEIDSCPYHNDPSEGLQGGIRHLGTHPDSCNAKEDFIQAKREPDGEAQEKWADEKSLNPVRLSAYGIPLIVTGFRGGIVHGIPGYGE
jgi:hypothetical protein